MASANVERLAHATEAYNGGDVEPLVALLGEDVDWRAPTRGHLWWKQTPHCHGPAEARANFESRLEQASLRPGHAGVKLEEIREVGNRIMLAAVEVMDDGEQAEAAERFFQVVTMRDGKIVDIQGCRSRKDALKRLRTA